MTGLPLVIHSLVISSSTYTNQITAQLQYVARLRRSRVHDRDAAQMHSNSAETWYAYVFASSLPMKCDLVPMITFQYQRCVLRGANGGRNPGSALQRTLRAIDIQRSCLPPPPGAAGGHPAPLPAPAPVTLLALGGGGRTPAARHSRTISSRAAA